MRTPPRGMSKINAVRVSVRPRSAMMGRKLTAAAPRVARWGF
jgi:hypothetical protein